MYEIMRPSIITNKYLALVGISLSLVLFGCVPAKKTFRVVQFCFTKEDKASVLRETLKQIANNEHMIFRDVSGDSFDQIKQTEVGLERNKNRSEFISIFSYLDEGMTLGASNLGLGDDQVAVSFIAGKNQSNAVLFADAVVLQLKQKWVVKDINPNSGALPMTCSFSATKN